MDANYFKVTIEKVRSFEHESGYTREDTTKIYEQRIEIIDVLTVIKAANSFEEARMNLCQNAEDTLARGLVLRQELEQP